MKKQYLLITMSILFMLSCSVKKDMADGGFFNQQAMLYKADAASGKQASFYDVSSITVTKEDNNTVQTASFFTRLVKENYTSVTINLGFDKTQIEKYNNIYGTTYMPFPDSLVQLTKTLKVDSGNVRSTEGTIKITIAPALVENVKYMIAVTMQSASNGVEIMKSSNVLFYVIEKSQGIIKKTVPLSRDTYLRIEGNTNVSDMGNTFTMEGLIYVDKFRDAADVGDAQISTFMGTEGATLMRFGDAGVPGNHLQANGQDIGVEFKTKQWYHIAMVVDGAKTTAYVNGKKIIDYNNSGSLGDFFIGRSYNDNRGFPGKISEMRLWKTARTATEIKDNMYSVNKTSANLYAYWKMNEIKNNKIEDVSGHGKDLILMGQSALSGQQTIQLVDENGIKVN